MTKIFICGDIVNYTHDDGMICSEQISKIIKDADYSICNFEAPIESDGVEVPKIGPHHYQNKGTIKGLKRQGFNLLCLANNHIMDYGDIGLKTTLDQIQKADLEFVGAGNNFREAYKPLIKTINGHKFGFINACEAQFGVLDYSSDKNSSGYAWINHNKIDEYILTLKKECDFVIVLAHAGLEHYNIPQKEWRQRYKHLCTLGADVVVGSHPHVPQGYERYNNSIIFYSLGNFYFDSKKYINKEDKSYSVILDFKRNKEVNFDIIYHHKKDKLVQLSKGNQRVDIEALNSYIEKNYNDHNDRMSLEVYYKNTRPNILLSMLPFPYDGNYTSSLKRVINGILRRIRKLDKELLSLHYFRNETYYYVTKQALELIAKKKINGDKNE